MEAEERKEIAIISAKGLGDGLLTMVIAYNLHLLGHRVHFLSDILLPLKSFFPDVPILNFPERDVFPQIIGDYTIVCCADGILPEGLQHKRNANVFVLDRDRQRRDIHYVESFAQQFDAFYACAFKTQENGMKMPIEHHYRKNVRRVCIHPTSKDEVKNWDQAKFVALAKKLICDGWEPVFTLKKEELKFWQCLSKEGLKYVCLPLDALAVFIYESGFMIANDSGPGHLASNMGIPLLSIFRKQSTAVMWGPLWGASRVVAPAFRFPGRQGTRYWRSFLSVRRVYNAFNALTHAVRLADHERAEQTAAC